MTKILKIKDWIEKGNQQFQVIRMSKTSPPYIQAVKRIKDGLIFQQMSSAPLQQKNTKVRFIKFHENLINVDFILYKINDDGSLLKDGSLYEGTITTEINSLKIDRNLHSNLYSSY